jgi:hypothetical protein
MNVDEFINFLMDDIIYERILEQSMETHLDEIYKKEDKYEICEEKKKLEEEDRCLICLEMIQKGEEVYKISCNHPFHINCLNESVSFNHKCCPICRDRIPLRKKNEHIIEYRT